MGEPEWTLGAGDKDVYESIFNKQPKDDTTYEDYLNELHDAILNAQKKKK